MEQSSSLKANIRADVSKRRAIYGAVCSKGQPLVRILSQIGPFRTQTFSRCINVRFLNTFGKLFYKLHDVLSVLLLCILNLRANFGMNYLQTVGGHWSARRKPVSLSLCLPWVPFRLAWDWIQASQLKGRRLTAWSVAWPSYPLDVLTLVLRLHNHAVKYSWTLLPSRIYLIA